MHSGKREEFVLRSRGVEEMGCSGNSKKVSVVRAGLRRGIVIEL